MTISVEVAILSEPGGRMVNEDACGYWRSGNHFCAVLADGAGGHAGGEVASRLAIKSLLDGFSKAPPSSGLELAGLVHQTNQAVLDARSESVDLAQMHTTIVSLSIDLSDGQTHWVHCGDSRLYWFQNKQLVERTQDHSLVQSLVNAGLLEEQEIRTHPQRNVLQFALGLDDSELDLALSPISKTIQGTNVFLLCSDGVWEYVNDATLEILLASAATPSDWLASIQRAVLEATSSKTTHDNYSAMAIWLEGESQA